MYTKIEFRFTYCINLQFSFSLFLIFLFLYSSAAVGCVGKKILDHRRRELVYRIIRSAACNVSNVGIRKKNNRG